MQANFGEEAFIAFEWSYSLRCRYVPEDFAVFERWVDQYVDNWAKCDTLCNHTLGSFVEMYPQFVDSLAVWARSENRWLRRASAVTLILPARKGLFLKEVFEISDILLTDKDDMVQKGYGWMLKETSKRHPGGGLRLRDEVEGKDAAHSAALCYREDAGGDEKKGDGTVRVYGPIRTYEAA